MFDLISVKEHSQISFIIIRVKPGSSKRKRNLYFASVFICSLDNNKKPQIALYTTALDFDVLLLLLFNIFQHG